MQLKLKQEHWQAMQTQIELAMPLESCGLLAGKNDTVEKVIPIPNEAKSPTRFRMEPKAQLTALNFIEANELELLGIFHSHPDGPDVPSPTDIEEAAYPVVHVIWSRRDGQWRARGFLIENHRVNEVILRLKDNE